jgi:hydrogenase-1 operon protein HyaF
MNPVSNTLKVEIGGYQTGNVPPLLHEIRHALRKLLDTGEATTIDLRGLPMAAGEQEQLIRFLGKGEINAQLNALGKSEIYETSFPGIWLITHYNTDEKIMGKFIEITRIPAILEAQTNDMEDALAELQMKLDEL